MSIAADHHRFIVSVATHVATPTHAILGSPSSELLAQQTLPTITAGLAHVTAWIGHSPTTGSMLP